MFLCFLPLATCRTVFSIYDPIGDKLCVNYRLLDWKSDGDVTEIREFSPGVRDDLKMNIFKCDTFHWGLGTNNSNNDLILENGDKLKFWIDDATTFTEPPTGTPCESSKQLDEIVHASFLTPNITIIDKVTRRMCNLSNVVYNEEESLWETVVDCPDVNNYEIEFSRLPGWFVHGSNPPVSHSAVYPGVPKFFGSWKKDDLFLDDFTNTEIAVNPCRPSLSMRLENDDVYVSPTYFKHYYKTKFSGMKKLAFTDNSVVMYDGRKIYVTNFLDETQRYEADVAISELRTPEVCSLSLSKHTYLGKSIIVGLTKGKKTFTVIDLTNSPTTLTVSLPNNEVVVDIVTTLSYMSEIFVLSKNKDNEFYVRKWDLSFGFTLSRSVPAADDSSLHWTPFGFLFITVGDKIYHSHDTALNFVDMEFFQGSSAAGNFMKITENKIGEFLVTTDKGRIFYFSLDSPYLLLLETTCLVTDRIMIKHDNTFVIISGRTLMAVPLKSEFAASEFYMNEICPRNYIVEQDIKESVVYLDIRDTLTYKASIISEDGHGFRIKSSNIVSTNSTSTTLPIVKLGSKNTSLDNVHLSKIDVTISPATQGTGRVMIHTSAMGWTCGHQPKVFDVIVGCPGHRELRVRNNNANVFYSEPYYMPILDIYDNGNFVEEYTGNFSVSSNKKFFFTRNAESLSSMRNSSIKMVEEGTYKFVFKVLDNWSYCDLQANGEATLELSTIPFHYYVHTGFGTFIVATLLYIVICLIKSKCEQHSRSRRRYRKHKNM